jgi:two-component system chemotaxis sensor kinase CheA
MNADLDPSLMQDFLTEAAELIEQLDADLVKLEAADAGDVGELCNACFRALHTIKGAASFLGLGPIIGFAHAAEDALNRLRKGDVAITPEIMDAMLRSADVVREQIDALTQGDDADEGPADLIAQLHAIAHGHAAQDNPDEGNPGEAASSARGDQPDTTYGSPDRADTARLAEADVVTANGTTSRPLDLPPQKADLVEFMVTDLRDYLTELDDAFDQLGSDATRADAAAQLAEIGDNLTKTADFFELDDLTRVVAVFAAAAETINDATPDLLDELVIRLRAAQRLVAQQADALTDARVLEWPLDTFLGRIDTLCKLEQIEPQFVGLHMDDLDNVMALDGLVRDDYPDPNAACNPTREAASTARGEQPDADHAANPADAAAPDRADTARLADDPPAANDPPVAAKSTDKEKPAKPAVEQTIRVEVGRLEALLNLVGQLVLNKNRVLALTRDLTQLESDDHAELREHFTGAASELDHLMSELQVSVMRTRMQPLAKLFDRYPRVIRDIARATDKKIELVIEGKDTEVDKSVLEQLADPLVHILRNSADHGVETPDDRAAAGKPPTGTITLRAEHQGSHVRVAITDDGKGLDREVIGGKAVERGLASAEQVAQMPDDEVFQFIFAAGFSTAAQVSDLSGRGVGMDVVKTNIQKVNGQINIASAKGKGTTMEILIPLTVAIMPAMVVRVGRNRYAIPLQSIVEIVKPEQVHNVGGQPVMRLRDKVMPLLDLSACLDESIDASTGQFAVVVGVGGQTAGMLVDQLIGQQEIVIKSLDDGYTRGGPYSGATIQEDGGVSLILDVIELMRAGTPAPRPNRVAA